MLATVSQLEQFLVSFTWKKVFISGLLRMISWGCCEHTLLCKTCLHAVYHHPKAGVGKHFLRRATL